KQYHFIMNYDGSQMAIYINGSLDTSEAFTGSIDTTSNDVYIGQYTSGGNNFDGLIDDIRIYSRALSAAEIEALYYEDGWPLPAAPTGLAAATGNGQVTLTWSPNTELDLSHYVVYQDTTQGFTPTSADSVGKVLPPDTSFTATGLTNDTTYYFKVAAVDESGNYSAATEEVNATPYDPLRVGLVAYYPFSGNANDESGNGNNGTVYGAALEADRFGNAGSAYSFDGVDDVLRIDDFHSWTDSITLSIWTRINAWNTEDNPLFNKHEEFYVKGLGDSTGFYLAGVGIMWVNVVPPLNEWTHVLASYDGTVMKLYVNGALKGDKNLVGTILDSSYPLYIASDEAGAYHYLNGQVDDARIYNRALSEAEIGALYQEGGWLGTATGYITGTGEVAFPGTDIVLNFTSQSGTDTIQVAAFDADPGGTLPANITLVADRYWTITHTGSGTFMVDMTLNLGTGAFDAGEQSAPGNLKLLRRESNGSGEWAAIRSGATAIDSTVTFAGLTGFSQFAIGRWSDTEGPAIANVAATTSPSIGNAITVSATVTDGGGIQSATLYYARGGASSYSQVSMSSPSADTYSGTVPMTAVTPAGVVYYIAAEDSSGNVSRSDTASIQVQYPPGTITSSTAGSAFRYGFPKNKWRLISIPGDIADTSVSSIIQSPLESAPSDETWKIFQYVGPGPDDYAAAGSFASGQSYFLKQVVEEEVHFTLGAGQSVDLTGWSLTLPSRKWRLVSSPYPFPVTVAADQGTFIGPYAYGAFGSGGQEGWSLGQVQDTFRPWGGYIIYNDTDQDQTLELRPPSLAKTLLAKSAEQPVDGWLLEITVEGTHYFDEGNTVGRIQGASEDRDEYDHPEPPYLEGYVSLAMDRPDWSPNSGMSLFTSDVRALDEANGVWDLDLRSRGETGPITLACELQGEVPPGVQVVLLDLAQRQVYDLTAGVPPEAITDYRGELPYHFKVITGTPDYVQGAIEEALAQLPEEFALSQNYPNPFNPSTTIEYALPKPAKVSLRVYNLLGREIAALIDDWQDLGYHEIVWHGRDRAGRSVASGVYFVVLQADGLMLTRKMLLLK
ncbi:MAG: T9SS type A sorting domain-containing protein, partial [Planctomycetes bacterium]|nr:T9SS type A sorting domain-containing protein [Planctomycetota bacterium]